MQRSLLSLIPTGSGCAALLLLFATSVWASAGGDSLLFREDWRETPAEIPLSQKHVATAGVRLNVYGPGAAQLKKSNHPEIPNDPYYVWSGLCEGTWMVALEPEQGPIDLSGAAKVRWRSRQSGFRELRLTVRTADGQWYVSEQSDAASPDWREWEVDLSKTGWRELVLPRIYEGKPAKPDLSRVTEVGFTDLMPGGQSAASSRLDWIEVHRATGGNPLSSR